MARNLYGGYMSCALPFNAVDLSNIRQVPDHQEVFVHPDTDQSIIFEILEYVSKPDEEAIKEHFHDLAVGNDAEAENDSEIVSVHEIPVTEILLEESDNFYLISGKQNVAKFSENARNTLSLGIGLFRLSMFDADVLVTFNDPVIISTGSSSHVPVATAVHRWTEEDFVQVLKSLSIVDVSLFGS